MPALLPNEFCPVAVMVRSALKEGRRDDAIKIAMSNLREGYKSSSLFNAIEEMLRTPDVKRSSKNRQIYPSYWYEIGIDYDILRAKGLSFQESVAQLEEKYAMSDKTICLRIKCWEEHMEADAKAKREF